MKKVVLFILLLFIFYINVNGEELPSYYDLRNVNGNNYITSIKDQKSSLTCWAFASMATLESNILSQYNKSYDFSELHLAYTSLYKYFSDGVNDEALISRIGMKGGTSYDFASYLTKLKGPILESEFPFDKYYDINVGTKENHYVKTISLNELNNKKTVADVNDIVWYKYDSCDSKALEIIKKYIMSDGALLADFYSGTSYMNKNYLYNNSVTTTNHYVSIIGWDDKISKSNFKNGVQPSKNGAFIVKNSWGEGNYNGIYYISYEDINVCKNLSGYRNIDFDVEDNVYYYDRLGFSMGFGYGSSNYTAWAANKFKKKTNNIEVLKEVTLGSRYNTDYEIYISYEENGNINLNNRKLIGKGNINHNGYGTHKFNEPVVIDRDFSIIVKYTSVDQIDGYPIAVQSNNSSGYENTILDENQCFVSKSGTDWFDLYNHQSGKYIPSIKAYTDNLNYSFNISGVKDNSLDRFNISLNYNGINDVNNFKIKIYDSNSKDVSNKFNIRNNLNNKNIVIEKNDYNLDNGNYNVKITYGYISKEVNINLKYKGLVIRNMYVTSNYDVNYLKGLNKESKLYNLMSNISSNLNIKLYRNDGKTIVFNNELVGTGMILVIGSYKFEMVIIGDLNGDGKQSIIDLSQLRQHLAKVSGKIKSGAYLEAGDLNNDNNVSITDLSKMRKELAG